MIKSTATAGPVELQASPPACFLWEIPGKPVSVRLSLDVVDGLERDVLQSFRAITARGSEVGGLLLGRTEGTSRTVIDSYELVACDYTRGPLYLLSDEEKARIGESIGRKKGLQQVVGYFRGNTRKELALDEEDLEVFQQYFARPEQVFLLVKPYAAKASVGAFFIWENGKVRTEASYLEFPFRRAELVKGEFAKSIVVDAGAKEAKGESNGTPASPPARTGSRAPVLPFALKREEEPPVAAPPLKREERAPVVTLGAKPGEEPAPAARKTAEPVAPVSPAMRKAEAPASPAARKSQPPVALPPLREEKRREEKKREEPKMTAAPATADAKPTPAPPADAEETLPERSVYGGRKLWALFGGLTMLALAGGSAVYLRSHSHVQAHAAANQTALQLRAEPHGDRLLVSWNKEADLVKGARRAVLSITDGPQKEDVQLDLTQLHFGSIEYTPVTADVSFRLEVADSKLGTNRSEYVRVLKPISQLAEQAVLAVNSTPSGNPAVNPVAAVQPPQAQQPLPPPQTSESAPSAADGGTPAAEETPQATAAPGPPPKPFSLAARVRPAVPADLPEAPHVESAVANTAAARPLVTTNLTPPAPPEVKPAPPAAQAPATATPSQNARVGGKVQEATLIRRVDAIYPPMARQARVGGTVRMQAAIGKDGHIKKVQVLSGHPLLRQAAMDAVQKWVYNPSTLNGTPVESTTEIELIFNLSSAR